MADRMDLASVSQSDDLARLDATAQAELVRQGEVGPLELVERRHARVGVAVITRDRCLPWARGERCLVCEEQCPYSAVVLRKDDGYRFGLPFVEADRCNGCGRCEDRCPVTGDSAIVVEPHGELRLSEGSYVAQCRSMGLVFEDKDTLAWEPEKSVGDYNLYRDRVSDLAGLGYGTCEQWDLADETATDTDPVPAGDGFFYLVTAENRLDEEGTKGTDGAGTRRKGNVCP